MELNNLRPSIGSTKKRKRIGRGPGSGKGKTAGKGHKGQKARSGGSIKAGFEGACPASGEYIRECPLRHPFRIRSSSEDLVVSAGPLPRQKAVTCLIWNPFHGHLPINSSPSSACYKTVLSARLDVFRLVTIHPKRRNNSPA